MKKKVCVLLHGLGCDGISTLFANLSHSWTGNCDITYFLAVDAKNKQFWDEFIANDNIKVVRLHDLNLGRIAKWPVTLFKALKKYGSFDVVHTNMDMLNGLNMLVAKLCGVPNRICHSHRGGSERHGNVPVEIVKKIYRWSMKKLMVSLSNERLGCSEVAGEYFFGKDNFDILINGIDLSKYKRITPPHYMTDVQCDTDSRITRVPVFCCVGRFTLSKNPHKTLGIFSEIAKRIPDVSLVWCGSGLMFDEIKAKASELGLSKSINFIGLTHDVPEYLIKADYFLMPSLFEGLSLALVEAQAADLICFVSDECSKLSDCGKIKFIPLNYTDSQWADIICETIDNPSDLQINPLQMKRFDIKQMAVTLESYYNK